MIKLDESDNYESLIKTEKSVKCVSENSYIN